MSADLPCPVLFITGTDTGVGKTVVTAALARHLADSGLRVGVMKPVETGVADPAGPGADACLLTWAARAGDPVDWIAPYRLQTPVAPAQAAALEKQLIDPTVLEDRLGKLAAGKDIVLVEGAGGLMVPVRGGFLIADLVKQLDLPLLIVARTGLGTLNHTLLTVYCARNMGIRVAGIFLNGLPAEPGPADRDAARQLSMTASADLLGVLPATAGDEKSRIEKLAVEIGSLQTRSCLMNAIGLPGINRGP